MATSLLNTLLPLLTFLGGGAVALLGAWIGPAMQRKIAVEETAQANRRMLLSKAEEVFVEIDRALSDARQECFEANQALHGHSRERTGYIVGDLGRLRGLLFLHFPSTRTLISDYDVAIARMTAEVTTGSDASSATKLSSLAFEGYRITRAFLTLLERRVAEQAEALHLISSGGHYVDGLSAVTLDEFVEFSRNEGAKLKAD